LQPAWVHNGKIPFNELFIKFVTILSQGYPREVRKGSQGVIFWDFSRAFSAVSPSILYKLCSIQQDKTRMCWLKDWLMGRHQRVLVNGIASGWQPVTSGVLQGSIFKAVLFSVFFNYVHKVIEGTFSLWMKLNWEEF